MFLNQKKFLKRSVRGRLFRQGKVSVARLNVKQWQLTRILWTNWVVVGFSKKFFHFGSRASKSVGIHRSAIFGKELYTSPASRPATKAPVGRGVEFRNKKTTKLGSDCYSQADQYGTCKLSFVTFHRIIYKSKSRSFYPHSSLSQWTSHL